MIINVDVKSLEWCTYLFLSQDPVGIEEWNAVLTDPTKHDIHTSNQIAFDLPSRLIAKIFLFRWIYRGPAHAYAYDPDFNCISKNVKFWQDVIDKYNQKYYNIYQKHLEYINTVNHTGHLVSPFGRVHEYEMRKQQGVWSYSESDITNHINQGLGADLLAIIRVIAHQRVNVLKKKTNLVCDFISTVHDSIVLDTPKENLDIVASLFEQLFRDIPSYVKRFFGVSWNIPMRCEILYGPNMADLQEYK